MNPAFIEKRRVDLKHYFRDLFVFPFILQSEEFQLFLLSSETPQEEIPMKEVPFCCVLFSSSLISHHPFRSPRILKNFGRKRSRLQSLLSQNEQLSILPKPLLKLGSSFPSAGKRLIVVV